MIKKILKGYYNSPNESWMHGRPCVAVINECIARNITSVSYITDGEDGCNGTHTREMTSGEMFLLHDGFNTVFDSDDQHKVLESEAMELKVGEPMSFQMLFGDNVKSFNLEFK